MSDTSKGIENSTSKHQENHAFPDIKGVPLSEACFRFAAVNAEGFQLEKRCRVLLETAKDGPSSDEFPSVYQEYDPKDGNARFNLHLRRLGHLFQHLFDNLFEGVLVAKGRMLLPELQSEFQEIPRELFSELNRNGSVDDWNYNQFTALGFVFSSVKVSANKAPWEQIASKRKVGRKSSAGIESAIEHLVKSQPGFWTIQGGRTKQCDLVRTHIFGTKVNHVEPPLGYRDGAIKNRLRAMDPS